MKFEEIVPALRDGKTAESKSLQCKITQGSVIRVSLCTYTDDWEIVESPEEKLHRERHEWALKWLERVIDSLWETRTEDILVIDDLRKIAKDVK